jgi:hypothetical protein
MTTDIINDHYKSLRYSLYTFRENLLETLSDEESTLEEIQAKRLRKKIPNKPPLENRNGCNDDESDSDLDYPFPEKFVSTTPNNNCQEKVPIEIVKTIRASEYVHMVYKDASLELDQAEKENFNFLVANVDKFNNFEDPESLRSQIFAEKFCFWLSGCDLLNQTLFKNVLLVLDFYLSKNEIEILKYLNL